MKIIITLFLIVIFPQMANAQNGSAPIRSIHRQILDNNQDMSLEEIRRFYAERFDALDLDKNKQLDYEEYLQIDILKLMRSKIPQGVEYQETFQIILKQNMQQWDQDKDGGISLNEYLTLSMPFATRLDTNGDQIISIEEVTADMEKRQELKKIFENSIDKSINEIDGLMENLESIKKE